MQLELLAVVFTVSLKRRRNELSLTNWISLITQLVNTYMENKGIIASLYLKQPIFTRGTNRSEIYCFDRHIVA